MSALVLSGGPLRAAEPTFARALDAYLKARTELGRFSGAVLVARGSEVLFRKGYGYADVEARRPFTPETQNEMASISKMFTAMAALKLRDEGKLKLDDSICEYLDPCPEAWGPVTVRHLVHHASGIPDYEERLGLGSAAYLEFMTRPDATERILEEARRCPLEFAPGTKFHYSNSGYVVLAHVIQAAAGRPFAEYVTETLLKPAGMSRSGFFGAGPPPDGLATGYTHGDPGWARMLRGVPLTDGHLKAVPRLPLTPPAGDAGLYSTVDDLLRWSLVMDGGRLVPAAEADEAFTPGLDGYGFGWFSGEGFGRRRYRHNGALPGYLSDFVKFPDDGLTVIVLANLDRTRLSALVRDTCAIVLGLPWDMPARGEVVSLPPAETSRLEGRFSMADGRALTVRRGTELLEVELEGRFSAGLVPLGPLEFYFPLGDGKAFFALDEEGRAVRVNLRYSGEDHVATRPAASPP
ncbi:MAG: serine hydrolase domain-containing protein [Thermoanaerobaculia bacterium]